MVERLCAMADLPKPRLAVIPTDMPNAFATGRNPKNSVVAVTEGSGTASASPRSRVSSRTSFRIGNRDVAIMTVSSFFAMVAALLMRMGMFGGMFGGGRRDSGPPVWLIMFVVSMITYVISYVLILMISRYREYAADRGAAIITGAPENLMSALQRIASNITQIPQRDLREVQGLNAFFIVPTNVRSSFAEMFMTHPPLEKRLARLAEIAREMGRPVEVGLRDALFGRKGLKKAEEALFALPAAAVTMDVELGLKPAGVAAVIFKPLSAGEFVRAENEMQELLDVAARDSSSKVERRTDSYGTSG